MASLIDNLISVLQQENSEYEQLLALSVEKTEIIVSNQPDALTHMVEREQEVVERINVLEKKRNEATNDIAQVLNKDSKTLTLDKLIVMLSSQKDECERLSKIHDKLKMTLQSMVRVNDSNKALLQESIDMVEFEMNLVQGLKQGPATANYSGNNYADNSYESRGMFDAKQ